MPSRLARPQGLADMLLYRINRIRAVGGGMVLRYCEGQFGVTRREWVMLALLSASGPISSSELASRAELDKSATSKAVTALLARGLVTRSSRAGDRRFAQLELTPAGQDLYQQILPVVEGINRDLMSTLQPAEVAQLDDMLERVQQRADELWREASDLPRADRRHGGTRALR
jgi:DNA-binding MarR family transcriptional regulator